MKDSKTIEAVEKNTYECMEWMENKIKEVIENLMNKNEKRFYGFSERKDGDMEAFMYDQGYAEGIHDALLDVLSELEIEFEEEYYNP